MAITASGAVSTALTQKRRVMLRSSESSSIAPATGTSAMPHFGQLPGLGLRISGCIGQVYSALLVQPEPLAPMSYRTWGSSPDPSAGSRGAWGRYRSRRASPQARDERLHAHAPA